MANATKQKQEDFFDQFLDSIKPEGDEFIEKRIHHINFARVICWLCIQARKKNVFYPNELRQFLRVDNSSIHNTLKGISETTHLSKKRDASGRVYYLFKKDNDGTPTLKKFFKEASKTLGKKPKMEITYRFEDDLPEDGYF